MQYILIKCSKDDLPGTWPFKVPIALSSRGTGSSGAISSAFALEPGRGVRTAEPVENQNLYIRTVWFDIYIYIYIVRIYVYIYIYIVYIYNIKYIYIYIYIMYHIYIYIYYVSYIYIYIYIIILYYIQYVKSAKVETWPPVETKKWLSEWGWTPAAFF